MTDSAGLRHVAHRLLAVVVSGIGAYLLIDYPVLRPVLAGFLLVYGAFLIRWPRIWLAVLPACVPALQLAHWSGRLFVEDLDIVLAFTLAALLWRAPAAHRSPRPPYQLYLAMIALAGSYLSSLVIGLSPWPDWQSPNTYTSFLGQANALRLAKGFAWALLLSPFVLNAFREFPAQSKAMLLSGMVAGSLAIGVMVLWERGVWQALLHGTNRYELLAPLLDFSTAYRVTGTFAEMHTGGEAIDGYLGLAWPMMVLALLLARSPLALGVTSLALGLSIYSLVTTFSRGLYLSLAIAGAVWLIGLLQVLRARRLEGKGIRVGALSLSVVLAGLLALFGYSRGGILNLASVLMVFGGTAWLAWRGIEGRTRAAWLVSIGAAAIWIALHAMSSSKWHPLSFGVAIPIAAVLVGGATVLGTQAGRMLPNDGGLKPFVVLTVLIIAGFGTLVPALLGYRMVERFSEAGVDLATRTSHWGHVLKLKTDDGAGQLFGMGLGSFPRAYHWDNVGNPDVGGDYALVQENGNAFLRTTGGKDLRLGQRLSIPAMEPLQLQMRVRSSAPDAVLKMRLCRRFVIHPSEWNGQCVTVEHRFPGTQGQWQTLKFDLNSAAVGDGRPFARAPLMLEINNRREYALMERPPAVVDLDDISLTDSAGRSLVANGDFSNALDRWLPYYDFNHLPWHIKNLWLHLYFEQGWLGILSFALTWLIGLGYGWRSAERGEYFGVGLAAALTGFVAVGTFGSPIDAPRVAWLYYFLFVVQVAHGRSLDLVRASVASPHTSFRQRQSQ